MQVLIKGEVAFKAVQYAHKVPGAFDHLSDKLISNPVVRNNSDGSIDLSEMIRSYCAGQEEI